MSNVNMLCYFMLTWVFENINSTCIITKTRNASRVNTKVFELLPYPQQLSQQEAAATYLASAVDMTIKCCFLVAQDIKQRPRK